MLNTADRRGVGNTTHKIGSTEWIAEIKAASEKHARENGMSSATERRPNGHDPNLIWNGNGRVNIKTLADLQHKVFPDLKELVPGLIVEGCLMLAGRPKLGKSWMTLDVGLAVAMGGKCFVDRQCVQGDVLYAR